jgi:anti-anti-sigma factor
VAETQANLPATVRLIPGDPPIAVVAFTVDLDLNTLSVVREALDQALNQESEGVLVRYLIVNLQQVEYIDSSALKALVDSVRVCKERGGSFHLCNLSIGVERIIEITRLERIISLHSTEETAVAAIQRAATGAQERRHTGT